ncbi:hypothetical protein MJK72_16805 [Klebsiella pneumoniae]|nr:hypothetical protein MJK72_16805 [Klebsiella pneumoniae]
MYGNPATLFAAEFMSSNNRLLGKVMALENAGPRGADRRRQLEHNGGERARGLTLANRRRR